MELPDAKTISSLLQLITPGIIITAIRVRAVTGIAPELKDKILEFGVLSVIYGSTPGPLFHYRSGPTIPSAEWQLLYSVLLPIIVGVILAYISAYGLTYRLAEKLRLPLAHHLPTAWDYTFGAIRSGTFILATLSDGTTIPGKMSKDSFASSTKDERDLLIEELWQIDANGTWTPVDPPRSMLICGRDIRLVEVF